MHGVAQAPGLMHAGSIGGPAADYSSSGSSSDDDELPLAQKILKRTGAAGQRSSSPSDAAAASTSSADSSRKRSASPHTAEQDQGSGESRRKREQKFKRISAKERCGHCHTCLNPQLRKACETVRQQQLLQAAGGNKATTTPGASKGARSSASTPSSRAAQPATATAAAMHATSSQTFLVDALERIISAHQRGGVTDTRHMPALQQLLESQTELGPRQVLLTVIKMSSDDVRTQIVKGPALKTLESWVVDASEGRDSSYDAAASATLMCDVIKCLASLPIDVEALRRTGIGRTFGKLPKTIKPEVLGTHTAQVAAACKGLVEQWKRLVEPDTGAANGAQKRKEVAGSNQDSHATKKLKPLATGSTPDGPLTQGSAVPLTSSSGPPLGVAQATSGVQNNGDRQASPAAAVASSHAGSATQQPGSIMKAADSQQPAAANNAHAATESSAAPSAGGSLQSGQASHKPLMSAEGSATSAGPAASQSDTNGIGLSARQVSGGQPEATQSKQQDSHVPGSQELSMDWHPQQPADAVSHAEPAQAASSLSAWLTHGSSQLADAVAAEFATQPGKSQEADIAVQAVAQPAGISHSDALGSEAQEGVALLQDASQPQSSQTISQVQQHAASPALHVEPDSNGLGALQVMKSELAHGSMHSSTGTGPPTAAATEGSTQASKLADGQQQLPASTAQSAAGISMPTSAADGNTVPTDTSSGAAKVAGTTQPGVTAAAAGSSSQAAALPAGLEAAAGSTTADAQQAAAGTAGSKPAGPSRPPGARTGGLQLSLGRLGAGSAGGDSSRLGGLRGSGSPALRLGSLRDRQGLPGNAAGGSASSTAAAIASSEQRAAAMFGGVDAATAVAAMQPVVSFPGGRLSAAERAAQAAQSIDAVLAADPELAHRVPAGARVGKRKKVHWPDDDKDLQTVRWFRKDDPPCKAAQDAPVPRMAQMGAAGGVMVTHHAPGFERAARREHAGERAALAAHHQEEEREKFATMERLKMMQASMPAWHRPPFVVLDPKWEVAAGEDSAERHLMAVKATQRAPASYPTVNHVPPNPADAPLDAQGPPPDPHRVIPRIPLQAMVAAATAGTAPVAAAAVSGSAAATHAPGAAAGTPFAATASIALPAAPVDAGKQVAMTSALSPELLSALGKAFTGVSPQQQQQQQQPVQPAVTTQGSELLANLGFLDRPSSHSSQPATQPAANAASAAGSSTGLAGMAGHSTAGQGLAGNANANFLAMLSALTAGGSAAAANKPQAAAAPTPAPAAPPAQQAATSSNAAPSQPSAASGNALNTLSSLLASIGSQLGMANTPTAATGTAQAPPGMIGHGVPAGARPAQAQGSMQASYAGHAAHPPGAPAPGVGWGAPHIGDHPAPRGWPHPAPPPPAAMVRERDGAWEVGPGERGGEGPGWGRGGGHRGARGGAGQPNSMGRGRGGGGDGEDWDGPGGAGGYHRGGGRGGRGGRAQRVCRFFNNSEGCKKGDTCDFLHVLDDGGGEHGMGNGPGKGGGPKGRGGRSIY